MTLGDLTVSASAEVASVGTRVDVATETDSLASAVRSSLVHSGGPTVKITLGEKAQPKAPITLRFKVDRTKLPKGSLVFAILSRSENASSIEVLPAHYNAESGLLTAKATHLSSFDWIYSGITEVLDKAAKFTTAAFNIAYPAPENCSVEADLEGRIYTTYAAAGIFPCLSVENGRVQVALHSTKGVPVTVRAVPSTVTGISDEIVTQADDLANRIVAQAVHKAAGASVLFGGETLTYSFDGDQPLRYVTVSNAFITMVMLYVAKIFETVILDSVGGNVVKAASLLSSVVQCFRDQFSASESDDKARISGQVLKGMLSCASGLASPADMGAGRSEAGVGTVMSLLILIPSVIGNTVTLIADEVSGNKTGTIRIDQLSTPGDQASSGAGFFVGRWQGTIQQPGVTPSSYDVDLTLNGDGISVSGEVEYPGLKNCKGNLRGNLVGLVLHLREDILSTETPCIDVDLTLSPNTDGTIAYSFDLGDARGTGTLRKVPSSPTSR